MRSNLILVLFITSCIGCSDPETQVGADVGELNNRADSGTDIAEIDTGNNDTTTTDDVKIDIPIDDNFLPMPLSGEITGVQPMTGIVLWEESWNGDAVKTTPGNIQLEYAYLAPNEIMTRNDTFDWSNFDAFLDRIAARGHQAIVRPYYTYPGRETAVYTFIKNRDDYNEVRGTTEGMQTSFPDWSNVAFQKAHLDFFTAFGERYDDDPRVAFLQVGFGLWGEYHIYDGPNEIGKQFPSKDFQVVFFDHLVSNFDTLLWSLSIDAGDDYYSPFAGDRSQLDRTFGNFDDSFMHEEHDQYNESMWKLFGFEQRFRTAPHGGELSYYTDFDQRNALNEAGIHGRTYEELSQKFYISYMIGNDQPDYQDAARIRAAGMANGYKFLVTTYETSTTHSRVVIENTGVAPIYYDAFPTIDGVRSGTSLKGLIPGETFEALIPAVGTFEITADRLVEGQTIEFAADLD